MMRRPPSSTLFPYPTLFRSAMGARLSAYADISKRGALALVPAPGTSLELADRIINLGKNERPAKSFLSIEDRKSTRLNSSHGYISYAVFCLKKKQQLDGSVRIAPTAYISNESPAINGVDDIVLRRAI